jgi:hypothetical protein
VNILPTKRKHFERPQTIGYSTSQTRTHTKSGPAQGALRHCGRQCLWPRAIRAVDTDKRRRHLAGGQSTAA